MNGEKNKKGKASEGENQSGSALKLPICSYPFTMIYLFFHTLQRDTKRYKEIRWLCSSSGHSDDHVSSGIALLSNDMMSATSWARDWGMLFGAEKNEHLTAHRTRQKQSFAREDVIMDGVRVPPVQEHKYTQVLLLMKILRGRHIQTVYSATTQRLGMLARLEKRLDQESLRKIFDGFVRPRLEYACCCCCCCCC